MRLGRQRITAGLSPDNQPDCLVESYLTMGKEEGEVCPYKGITAPQTLVVFFYTQFKSYYSADLSHTHEVGTYHFSSNLRWCSVC
jgi:hypothetical protein